VKQVRERKLRSATTGGLVTTLGAIAAVLLAPAPPVHAQESAVDALRAQIQELTERLNKLEADQRTTAETATKTAASAITAKEKVQISGLLQVQGLSYLHQDGLGPDAPDTFRLRRGELRLTAPSITDRVSGTVMFDPAKATFNRAAGFGDLGSSTIRARDNILQEIQLSYLLRPAATGTSDNIYLDIGQYKIPVGYESLQSTSALPLVERALIYTGRDPFDGGYGDVRDTGLQIRGTQGPIDFRLGIFNGFGDRQNTLATSDAKAVLGLLAYRPAFAPGLQVGVSGGRGNTGFNNSGSLLEGPRTDRDIFNLFSVYKKDKLTLQAEYLKGSAQGITAIGVPPAADTVTLRDIKGYYGHIGYLFTPKIEGIFRYDYLDSNRQASGDSTTRDLIFGLNYYLKGNNAKLQVNLLKRNGGDFATASSNPHSDLRNDRTELRTAFQVAF
jgi:Phosphate-selective porin O and P